MPKIEKHLENAILLMPEKDKNKLLIRLISKDVLLTAQLEHQLLGDDIIMIDRRNELLDDIEKISSKTHFNSPGYILMEMRSLSGLITYHYKVTKDKFGEVLLLSSLVNFFFYNQSSLLNQNMRDADTFAEYVVKKAIQVLNKAQKLHPDFHIELESAINEMLDYIYSYKPCEYFLKFHPLPRRFN